MILTPQQIENVNREVCKIAWPEKCWHEFSLGEDACNHCEEIEVNPDPLHDLNDAWAAMEAIACEHSIGDYGDGQPMATLMDQSWKKAQSATGNNPCEAICRAILATVGKTLEEVAGG
jgi:hypothetical protein